LVAVVDGKAVGVAYLAFTWTLEHGGKTAWLEEMYVLPAHRGQGIGRALLTAVCTHASEQGCAAVDLEVDAAHQRAVHLYAREGFRPLDRTRWVRQLP
jgi:GNAT superfamily N-acetyltransferase